MEDNNEPSETIVINDNLTSSIEEGEILNKRKVVGLYDPEENGFDLEMWNNTEPNKIFELSKKINNMTLSEDAKNIYTKLLLTNSYSPKDEILVGSLVKSFDPLLAFSVYPTNAGIAV